MENKLIVKDFISIGLFAVLIIVVFFAIGIVCTLFSPLLYFFSFAIVSIFTGPIYFLFIAKVQKKRAVILLGIILVVFGVLQVGGVWPSLVFGPAAIVLAEIFARKGKFKSFAMNTLSYVTFSFWSYGLVSSFWILKEKMLELSEIMGADYVAARAAVLTPLNFVLVTLAMFICAIIGAFVGKKLLKKHFEKAGVA